MRFRHVLVFVLAAATVGATSAFAAIVPSETASRQATIKEVRNQILPLVVPGVNAPVTAKCTRLDPRLYRCEWHGTAWLKRPHIEKNGLAEWFGRAKVRFHTFATDVTLYQVQCFRRGDYADFPNIHIPDCPYRP